MRGICDGGEVYNRTDQHGGAFYTAPWLARAITTPAPGVAPRIWSIDFMGVSAELILGGVAEPLEDVGTPAA